MKITRLVELTLFYKIRELLSIAKTGEILKSGADFKTYNVKYINIDTSHPVKIYIDNVEVTTGFIIDYIDGTITFDIAKTVANIVKADYWYCPINIYDEGKDPRGDSFHYPAIAIYEDTGDMEPIELGSGKQERVMSWILEVWTERGGERNDLVDTLIEFFEESNIPIIDFNSGFPTNTDNSLNTSFNSNNILTYALCDSINYSKDGSLDIGDKPKYLSQIHVSLRVFPL